MSTDIEFQELQVKLDRATPEQQRSLLLWLVSKVVTTQGARGPQALEGEGGEPIGVFIPNAQYRDPPPMSEERYTELLNAVRHTTPDQLLTHEEMMRELGLAEGRRPSKR